MKFQSQKAEGDTWQDHNTEVPFDGGTKSDMLLLRGQRLGLLKSQSYDGIIDAPTKRVFFSIPKGILNCKHHLYMVANSVDIMTSDI